jgi:thiamine pyrophosphate-dependent acetolactate synthase large subunit-like protein
MIMSNVRELVADAVASSGATTVFALMGAANQELICDLGERCGMQVVHCRHEASAVGMADGYSRLSGRTGVATVTAGPGVTNTATSLAVARAHHSPVLLLAGDIPDHDVHNPQRFEQERFTRLCAGDSGRITKPEQVGEVLQAAQVALAADRPYALHLPADVQEQTAPGDIPLNRANAPEPTETDDIEGQARAAGALLAGARRPVVLAGRGALVAQVQVEQVARLLGAPVVTTLRATGMLAGDALNAGVAGAMGGGRASLLLEEADVVLCVGASMSPLAVAELYRRGDQVALVRVDSAAPVRGLHFSADLRADAACGLARIQAALAECHIQGAVDGWGLQGQEWSGPKPEDGDGALAHPLAVLGALQDLLPEQRLMVIGGGHAALSACQLLPASAPRDFTCVSTDFGAIGQALPVAIGGCFARPGERMYHVTADGEFLMGMADFHTAVRYRLPLTVIVLNDQGFGQERHNLHRAGQPTGYADHASPDLAALAQAMGAHGYRITCPQEIPVLKEALDHEQGVVLVDVHIDPAYLNPASAHVAAAMSCHLGNTLAERSLNTDAPVTATGDTVITTRPFADYTAQLP